MFEDNKQDPLQIPNTLLKKPKIFNKDTIGQKHDFLNTGGNENLQIIPPIAKFTGFEINKLNILKLKILNQAPISQRVHVLPSKKENNVFQVKMIKKGQLASGINEDLYIHFRPQEYRYYYDTIRIHSETCDIIVPIHAYPVPNRQELRELFPKIIDFGTVEIGDTQLIRHQLKCKIPLNYEFQFVFTKPNSDIQITPAEGKIPGGGQIDIDLIYSPSNNATVVADVELRLSQFDYEPLDIKLIGNGQYPNPADLRKRQKNKLQPLSSAQKSVNSQQQLQPLKSTLSQQQQNPQQLNQIDDEQLNQSIGEVDNVPEQQQYKTLMRPSSKRSKLKQSQQNLSTQQRGDLSDSKRSFQIKKSQINNNNMVNQSGVSQQSQSIMSKQQQGRVDLIRQSQEKNFIDKFNTVRLLDKNKEIKFFQCIGDQVINAETIDNIHDERKNYQEQKLQEINQKGIHRYELELDTDAPIIEQVVPNFDCQWDFDKNDPMKRRFLIQKRLTTAGTKVILKNRKEERLQKIKNLLGNARTKEEVKDIVNLDHQKAEYAGIGKKDFTQFNFELEDHNINKFLLPIQYESSNTFSNFKFEVNPRTGFDDWSQIEPIEYCDAEVMDYRNQDMPQIVLYPPIEAQRKNRTGTEEEYANMGKLGQFEDPTQIPSLSQPIGRSFQRPFEIQTHSLLLPHSTIRRYYNYDKITEVDPEYYLQHEPIQTQDEFDPNPETEDIQVLKYEYLRKTPGLNSIQILNSVPLEHNNYFNQRLALPKDVGFESEIEKYCPGILPGKDYDDDLTDDDSDGEQPPAVKIEQVTDFLNEIEGKDEIIQNVREKNQKELFDEYEQVQKTIDSNLMSEKQKQISILPSKTSDYNRYINQNTNKLYIL